MKTIVNPRQMQREASKLKQEEKRIAFVPTMGALHEGHLCLIRRARKTADVVVVSIYVNPTQFGPKEDFKRYPRPLTQDKKLARQAGADIIFAPQNLYEPDASTTVSESLYSQGRCGKSRPGHFDGVTTVVTKLFLMVQPDVAIFGQKDAQQCDVIERMVRDLYFPVKIIRVPIQRDRHGLALSSRNQYLSPKEYQLALALPRALKRAAQKYDVAKAKLAKQRVKKELQKYFHVVEYVTFAGGALCAAVKVGKTRLLDNVRLKKKIA
ncbi:MAG: pantoate--beta-alanine ligase [Verrucomicrobiota bacterium]